jgi:hypothetical protein
MLDDVVFSDTISQDYSTNGWRRLKKTDPDYLKVNTVENYYEGNNGHNGNLHYDSGHEYFTYFQRLFKYAEDNGLFDTRCYREGFNGVYDSVHDIGFQGLINEEEEIKEHDEFLIEDTKIHFFGNYKEKDGGNDNNSHPDLYEDNTKNIWIYGNKKKYECKCNDAPCGKCDENGTKTCDPWKCFYKNHEDDIDYYHINDGTGIRGDGGLEIYEYGNLPEAVRNSIPKDEDGNVPIDDVTNQIVNNKRLKIKFYMKSCDFASTDGQIELKYMDKIVMNYLTQMLPSTVITEIEYNFCNYTYDKC